ncbi:AI-2E family transporter [Telluribacter sp.]|jgi:predicted PurR-regulated permease PerM|uniref:AI-2E family transporter n=1 Tax=Telluribacter sp. TaxID=1978767 RepID=UPI002E0E2F9B|nr:AI-2E family transporter [Telluribacter sp.]
MFRYIRKLFPSLPKDTNDSDEAVRQPAALPVAVKDSPASATPAPDLTYAQKVTIAVGITLIMVLVVLMMRASISILLLGFGAVLFAVLLRAIAHFIQRMLPQLPDRWGVGIATLLLLGSLGGFITYAAPQISEQFTTLTEKIPPAIEQVENSLNQSGVGRFVLSYIPTDGTPQLSNTFGQLTGIVGGLFAFITYLLVILAGGLFLALNPRVYVNGFVSLFPIPIRPRAFQVIGKVIEKLEGWLLGQFVAMLSVGVLTWIGLEIIGVPLALVLGVIIFIFDFVPFIGPLVGAVPGILVAFSYDPDSVIWVALVYIIVQQVESLLVVPLVQQKTVSLPPTLLMLGALLGGAIFGLPGTVIAIPALVVMITLIQEVFIKDILGDPME